MSAIRRYEEFHGKSVNKIDRVNFHEPKKLILIGEAVAIEYRCSKLNGGGDGKRAVYRHKFERPAIVAMDETGKKQLYVIGSHIVVDEAGIRN
jgi:hypothetical protein